jgi:hypothetical protein
VKWFVCHRAYLLRNPFVGTCSCLTRERGDLVTIFWRSGMQTYKLMRIGCIRAARLVEAVPLALIVVHSACCANSDRWPALSQAQKEARKVAPNLAN